MPLRSCISLSALLLATGATALHAAEPVRDSAFYVGATAGASHYSLSTASTAPPRAAHDATRRARPSSSTAATA